MSQQRFIRCTHCGLPHEADLASCPVTGAPIDRAKRRPPSPPPSRGRYRWAHRPEGGAAAPDSDVAAIDPEALDTFVGLRVEDKYLITELIGRGGMGAVFRAINERLGKHVALKIMYRGYSPGSDAQRRFLREARVASSLGHPNIVEVFDLGHLDGGQPFLVMELLKGMSLAERIQTDGALPEGEVLQIARQVLSALEAAHGRGVIHRDLKPENVYLTEPAGELVAKLLDFGVSKSLSEQTLSLTRTGVVLGTPYYLSPEQARGTHDVDARSDVWAMGVLLYEAITGVLPFNAPDFGALVDKICRGDPAPPSRFQARLAPEVEAVILRALRVDREERPASAAQMRAELAAAGGWERSDPVALRFPPFELGGAGDVTVEDAEPLSAHEPHDTPREPRRLPLDTEDVTEVSDRFSFDAAVAPDPGPGEGGGGSRGGA